MVERNTSRGDIQVEEIRLEIQRDLNEEKGWHGSKKFAQIRRRFRGKFERRKPPAFNAVKTYYNLNAKFTTYFDTYKIYVYGHVDPVAVCKKALDLTVEERRLRPGDKIRIKICGLNLKLKMGLTIPKRFKGPRH